VGVGRIPTLAYHLPHALLNRCDALSVRTSIVSTVAAWRGRDSRLTATSPIVGYGVLSPPDVAHVFSSTVDGVRWSGQATPTFGRRGLTHRPLRPVERRGTLTSLTSRGHVWYPPFDRRHSPFPGDMSLQAQWVPPGGRLLLLSGRARRNSFVEVGRGGTPS